MKVYDVVIVGAGAAGLMCAIEAGKRGRKVLLLDHAKKIAEKIRISGGGRCNFTNLNINSENFISQNPHFCKSALKQYTQFDFIKLVEKHDIDYHEKKLGQLFCNNSSQQIIDMLLCECKKVNVSIEKEIKVLEVDRKENAFFLRTQNEEIYCDSLVIATGGLSIPKIGASDFGYKIAEQFGLKVIETKPALVPFICFGQSLDLCKKLAGVSVNVEVSCGKKSFKEGFIFTHRGLSGPAILQISSYWNLGREIIINFLPNIVVEQFLRAKKKDFPKQEIQKILSEILPARLAENFCNIKNVAGRIADLSDKNLVEVGSMINKFVINPYGTEGYRTAEVTSGGVGTNELSSKTMEAKKQKNLYFIGEVVDVTGHLGGFNFQWAWSSGYVAGQNV